MLLLCLDRASADRVMREVHSGVCGPHMGGHMLARKIMRTSYFWLPRPDHSQYGELILLGRFHQNLPVVMSLSWSP